MFTVLNLHLNPTLTVTLTKHQQYRTLTLALHTHTHAQTIRAHPTPKGTRFQSRREEQPVDTHFQLRGSRFAALMTHDSASESSDSEDDEDDDDANIPTTAARPNRIVGHKSRKHGNTPTRKGRYIRMVVHQSRKVKCKRSCNGDKVFYFSSYLANERDIHTHNHTHAC